MGVSAIRPSLEFILRPRFARTGGTHQSAIFPATRRDAGLLVPGGVARRSWA